MQRNAWLGLLVFAAAVVTMGRVVVHDFTDWDDRYTIAQNPRLNPPTWEGLGYYWKHSEYGLYIPGTYTVWAGLAKLGWVDVPDERGYRINPWVFHSASVVLHGLAGVVVFGLLRKTRREGSGFGVQGSGQSDVGAFVGACLFAVHPVQVETVAWASGMKDVLCGLFSLIALWQYAGWVQAWGFRVQRRLHYMMATLAFVCALLCKPSAMVVPAMAVVIDWLLLRRSLVRALAGTALWWPIVLVWMVVARASQETYGIIGAAPALRPLVALDAIAFYLGKIAWPLGLAVDYGRTPAVTQDHRWLWWTWIFPVAIAGLLAWRPKRELIAAAVLLVIAIAPVLGLTPFLFQYYSTVADHYLYVAMIGPAIALMWVVKRWDGRWLRISLGAALIVLALLSIRQANVWRNDQTLFAHTIAVNPDSFLSHHNLGTYLVRQGDLLRGAPGAREHYLRAREMFARAIELRRKVNRGVDDNFDGYKNLALALERLDEWNAALLARQRALAIVLKLPPGARGDLAAQSQLIARNLMRQGRWAEALPYLDAALKANPALAGAREDREQVLRMMGK